MNRIVISIGGSILLTGQDDVQYLKDLSDLLKYYRSRVDLSVVVGGGRLAREYIGFGRQLGMDEAYLDELGIRATRLNAMLLISAMGDGVNQRPYTTVNSALEEIDIYNPIIMGGTVPGQTTDTVAAQLAKRTGANILVNATAVDGVYEADPKKHPEAKRFETLSFLQLMDIVGDSLEQAGTNIVIDPVAAKVIAEAEIKTYVLNGRDLGTLSQALSGEDFKGTIIK